MTNRVAFLSRLPPLAIFAKVFGIEYLSKSGFEVVFVDVSFLIDGVCGQDLYQEQLSIPGCETVVINRLEELEAFVKESFESTIFIDQVSGLAEFNPNTGQVFKVLKKAIIPKLKKVLECVKEIVVLAGLEKIYNFFKVDPLFDIDND